MNLNLKTFRLLLLLVSFHPHILDAQWMQWECRSNNTLSEFSNHINDMKDRGYAPVNISVVTYSTEPRVSSIWQKANVNDWACWHGMNQNAFVEKIKYFNQKGLSPIDIAVWKVNAGELRFAAIWQKISYEGVVEIGVTENELRQKIINYDKKGYSPRDINGYSVGDDILYTCIFDKQPRGQLLISFGNSENEFQKEFDKNTPLGFYPIDVNYFNYRGSIFCNGIWAKGELVWDSRKGYNIDEFQNYLEEKSDIGFSPIDVDQYYLNGSFYYGATLTKSKNNNQISNPSYIQSNISAASIEQKTLPISPVEQQTKVWCWLATGEMILKHYNIPNANLSGNYQCGIIGSIFYNSPCYTNCFNSNCIRPSGSNLNTLRMFKDYSWITSKKVFNCREGYELNFYTIKTNIDMQKPILCGISPARRQYFSGAEHAVVLIGYKIINEIPYVIINDPFPYSNFDNPYLKEGASILQKNQYQISLQTFTNNLFWHWSLSDIEIS